MDAEYCFNRSFHVRETKAMVAEMIDRLETRLLDPTKEEERVILGLEVMMDIVADALEREATAWDQKAKEVGEREEQSSQSGGEVGEPGVQE